MSLCLNRLLHTHLYTSGYRLELASASQFFRKFSCLSSWQTRRRYKNYFTGESHKRILIENLSYANPNLTINVSQVKNQTSKRVWFWQNHGWQKLSLELQQNHSITRDFVKLTAISHKQQVISRKQESANTSNTPPQSLTETLNQLKTSNSQDIQIITKSNRKKHIQTP